jgi:hypothetical protein
MASSYNPFTEQFGVSIGDYTFRGAVSFEGLATEYDYEIRKPKGTTGAAATKFLGRKNREFAVRFVLNTAAEYETYQALRASIPPPSTKTPNGVPIYHPLLNEEYGIDLVVIKKDVAPTRDDKLNRWTAELQLLEVPPPPKKTVAKATGAPKDVPTQSKLAEQDPNAEEIEREREKLGILQSEKRAEQAEWHDHLQSEVDSMAP